MAKRWLSSSCICCAIIRTGVLILAPVKLRIPLTPINAFLRDLTPSYGIHVQVCARTYTHINYLKK